MQAKTDRRVGEVDLKSDRLLGRQIEGTDNGISPRVGVKHEFDAVGRHIGSKIVAVGPSAAPPGDDASSDTPLSGGNTWDSMNRLTSSSCVYAMWPAPPPSSPQIAGDPGYLSFDQPESLADLDDYDRMGRLKHAGSTITGSTQDPRLEVDVTMSYDSLGRMTYYNRTSNEQTQNPYACDVADWYLYTHDSITGTTTRFSSRDALTVTTVTDRDERVASVRATYDDPPVPPQYEAVYTYYPNRNLVDTIAYGNRTRAKLGSERILSLVALCHSARLR